MAKKRISELTEATSAASGDFLELETAAGASKKITKANLLTGLDADLVDGAHASATPTANYIPIANGSGVLADGWLADRTRSLRITTQNFNANGLTTGSYSGFPLIEFPNATSNIAYVAVPIPDDYGGAGGFDATFFWSAAAADTGVTAWALEYLGRADGDALGTALTAATQVTDTLGSTAYLMQVKALGNIPHSAVSGKTFLLLGVRRKGNDAADTSTVNSLFFGLELTYTAK